MNVQFNLRKSIFSTRVLSSSEKAYRSSRPEVFLRKGVLKICSKFTGEHPCRSAISLNEKAQLHQSHFDEIWSFKKIFATHHLQVNKKVWIISLFTSVFCFLKTILCFFVSLWTQRVNRIFRPFLDVSWTSYVHSVYVLCPRDWY